MNKREEWRAYAELASKEKDPAKLLDLADKLCEALDEEFVSPVKLMNPVPLQPSSETTGP